jgi:putative peptide zinc metalloprotease protein
VNEHDHSRPKLRPDISFGPGEVKGERVVYYVNDRFTDQFYRVGEKEHFLLRRMDGVRTLEELSAEYEARFGRGLDDRSWGPLFKMLDERQMLEGRADEARLMGLKAQATEKRHKDGNKPFNYRFHLVDPDALLSRVLPWVGFMFRPGVVAACLASIVAIEVWVLAHLGELRGAAWRGASLPLSWPLFIGLLLSIAVLHEGAHGLACKYYGGKVKDVGVMWRYLYLFPYCKLDHIILFHNRRHRVYVAAAGTYVGLLMLVPFAFVWWAAPEGSLAAAVSAKMLTFYNLLTLINLFPFVQLDGYFMLSHALGMLELRQESHGFVRKAAAHRLLGRGEGVAGYGRRERRVYWVFGITSMLVTTCLLALMATFWYRLAFARFGGQHAWLVLCGIAIIISLRRGALGWLKKQYRRWHPEDAAASDAVAS